MNPLDTTKGQNNHWEEITLCQHRGGKALDRNHIVSTPTNEKGTAQKSHCVNTKERHSRRGITKNVHSLCISFGLSASRPKHIQTPSTLVTISQGWTSRLYCKNWSRPARSHSQQLCHSWRTFHWNSVLLLHRCPSKVFSFCTIFMNHELSKIYSATPATDQGDMSPLVVICLTIAPECRILRYIGCTSPI